MALLYSNENFPLPAVEELRRLGHDVLTSQEAGNSGAGVPDPKVLEFAASKGRALLTLNRKHFRRLHEESPSHSGIILCRLPGDRDFAGLARSIDRAISGRLHGRLISVALGRSRP